MPPKDHSLLKLPYGSANIFLIIVFSTSRAFFFQVNNKVKKNKLPLKNIPFLSFLNLTQKFSLSNNLLFLEFNNYLFLTKKHRNVSIKL